jgi:hypothetical protein
MKTKLFILTSILVFALALLPETSEAQRRRFRRHRMCGAPVVQVYGNNQNFRGNQRPNWRRHRGHRNMRRPIVNIRF